MLTPGIGFFIQIPGKTKERILHAATVLEIRDGTYTAEIEEDHLVLEAGQDILVYCEVQHRFMQQPARIEAILQTDPHQVIGFETTGEPISAEARECYRVSTVMANLTAIVIDESCPLLDVSASGFAVLSTTRHKMGRVVNVAVRYGDEQYQGEARIQSIREMPDGRIRYGLNALEDRGVDANLQKGQREITMDIQRQQLKRLARG